MKEAATNDLRDLRLKLINQSKQKFKYIIGHSKQEIQPGIYADERRFSKNIEKRIIKPSWKLNDIQDVLKGLHDQANKFEVYMKNMKTLRDKREIEDQQSSPKRTRQTKSKSPPRSPGLKSDRIKHLQKMQTHMKLTQHSKEVAQKSKSTAANNPESKESSIEQNLEQLMSPLTRNHEDFKKLAKELNKGSFERRRPTNDPLAEVNLSVNISKSH